MKESFLEECLTLLNKKEIKGQIKEFLIPLISPISDVLLNEFYPYIYLSLIFVIISFLLHLGIFFLLLRNKSHY